MKTILSAVGIGVLLVVIAWFPERSEAYCDASGLGVTTYGQSSQTTVSLQRCLIEAGYSIPAGPTGYFGEQTRSAVRAFYADKLGMPEWDGYSVGPIGRSTLVSVTTPGTKQTPLTTSGTLGYKRVANVTELQKYVEAEPAYGLNQVRTTGMGLELQEDAMSAPTAANESVSSVQPERVSETNVQVAGIDEPDIVKTDGQHIFLSRDQGWSGWARPLSDDVVMSTEVTSVAADEMMYMPISPSYKTTIIDAYPVDELAVASEKIEENGEMLLVKEEDVLIILAWPEVVAYDVSDPNDPEKLWERELGDNTTVVTARLLDGTVYLVTQTYLNRTTPCPVVPIRWGSSMVSVPCTSILVPERIERVSHLYTVLKLDPTDGSLEAENSVAGDHGVTVMMSPENLYVASRAEANQYEIMLDLMIRASESYVPASVTTQAKTIMKYDISVSGKVSEIRMVYDSYLNTLGSDERLRISNEIENKLTEMLKVRLRDMYRSRIVKIDLDDLSVTATGDVPGYLLNQFAMDEYEGNLRVAVTIDDGWGGAESTNDVYVLGADLGVIGQIQDLGLTERIYSVRFMGDTGYLVTFRQIDPFYVLDLSVPTAPKMVGELKIPGFSSYLEYLGDDLVLGVGREGNGVKLSIFDVSDPAKPIEKSKYQLKDYWSEVESNHHAFLRDAKHEVFFIPGGNGGYVFSYKNGDLSLEKAISGYSVKRALYVDDYLYIISNDKIRVFDEDDWEEVGELTF